MTPRMRMHSHFGAPFSRPRNSFGILRFIFCTFVHSQSDTSPFWMTASTSHPSPTDKASLCLPHESPEPTRPPDV
jgi:hypothetical protein